MNLLFSMKILGSPVFGSFPGASPENFENKSVEKDPTARIRETSTACHRLFPDGVPTDLDLEAFVFF